MTRSRPPPRDRPLDALPQARRPRDRYRRPRAAESAPGRAVRARRAAPAPFRHVVDAQRSARPAPPPSSRRRCFRRGACPPEPRPRARRSSACGSAPTTSGQPSEWNSARPFISSRLWRDVLAEAEARIDQDSLARDRRPPRPPRCAPRARDRPRPAHRRSAGRPASSRARPCGASARPARRRRRDHLRRAVVIGQRRHVVDHPRAGLDRCRHDVSLARVDRDRRAAASELPDRPGRSARFRRLPRSSSRPGRVDSPPTSMIAAPSRGHVRARLGCGRGVREPAAVGEAVGRGVDDCHHLRLVEADRSLAELQRSARRRSAPPIARPCRRRTALRCLRPAPARSRRACALDPDQLDRGEPGQPAGKPRDLPVMAEGRIDEGGRAKKRAHRRAL